MEYRNTKTGAIIDSPCIISGGDWIKLKEENKPQTEELNEIKKNNEVEDIDEVEEVEEPEEDFDGITVKQIKQELDAFGIKYNPRAKKQELYDLMMQGR